nr:MAG TPA: Keratinocyte-associated protein 2 [Caudoviricetes sp.]
MRRNSSTPMYIIGGMFSSHLFLFKEKRQWTLLA